MGTNSILPSVVFPRDFLQTCEGLFFAIVSGELEEGRVISYLRYRQSDDVFEKLNTQQGWELLRENHPDYVFRSQRHDVLTHAIPVHRIARYHDGHQRVRSLLGSPQTDRVAAVAQSFLRSLTLRGVAAETLAVSGSLLIGAQTDGSDIDIVVRDRAAFNHVRDIVRHWNETDPPSEGFWRQAYAKRAGSLSFSDYVWHQRRKWTQCCVANTKVDISLVDSQRSPPLSNTWTKVGRTRVIATVTDDQFAFDHPARWTIDSSVATSLVSWTATFTGQACVGETIEVAGWLEQSAQGQRQIVVGGSREAPEDVIRVVRS